MSFFPSLLSLLLVAAAALLCCGTAQAQSFGFGSVCFIFYGAPGTIDYPWSATVYLDFVYDQPAQKSTYGTYYDIIEGDATYTYTNKSGHVTVSSTQPVYANSRIYIDTAVPVDSNDGLSLFVANNNHFSGFGPSLQLPGVGPLQSFGSITLNAANLGSPFIQLGPAFQLDPASQAWVATGLPGFVNRVIAPSANHNSQNVNYSLCTAAISRTNGKVTPVTPTAANTATLFHYSYFISDNATYSVNTSLAVSASSTLFVDELGNTYQNITAVSGTRIYTYLPTGATVTSSVTGLSASAGTPSQRWYPFAYLQLRSHYTTNNAPYLDADGLGYGISPAAPINGDPPGNGTQYSDVTVQVAPTTLLAYPVLTELEYNTAPVLNKQRQTYTL